MPDTNGIQRRDYGVGLHLLPFGVFALLLTMRESAAYGHIFELLPVLGRTIPYVCLAALLLWVFIFRGGSLQQIGICWPKINKIKLEMTKFKALRWIFYWAAALLAMRIFVAVAAEPLLELLPAKIPRSTPLAGNLPLLLTLLPLMWLVVIGEEVLCRGLLMRFLAKQFGDTTKSWLLAAVISALIFGLGHMGKGPAAALGSALGGLVYGLGYLLIYGQLLLLMVLAIRLGLSVLISMISQLLSSI